MPASKTTPSRSGPLGSRTLALVGIAGGLAVYIAAFFLHMPIKTCMSALSPLEYDATEMTQLNYSPEWAGLVATRCEATLVNGPDAGATLSERVIEWGPSAVAAGGLVLAGTGLWFLLPPPAKKVSTYSNTSWPSL